MSFKETIETRVILSKLHLIIRRLHEPKIRAYMIDKLPNIVSKVNPKDFKFFISELLKYPDGIEAVKNKFDEIRDGCLKTKFKLKKRKVNAGVKMFFDFIENLKDIPEFQEEYELYGEFLRLYNSIDLEKEKGFETQQYIEKLRTKIFKRIITSKYSEEMKAVIDYISQNDGGSKYYAVGGNTFVFKTNTQVIKLGVKEEFKVPYHPRLMMPYFRKKYDTGVCLEVFNFADAKSAVNVSDQQLLEIYRELERDKIFWGDCRKNNLVVALNPNEVPDFILSKEFNVFGFLEDSRFPTTNHKVLPAGSLLVADLDYIYPIDDPNRIIGCPAKIIWEHWEKQKVQRELELCRGIVKNGEGYHEK